MGKLKNPAREWTLNPSQTRKIPGRTPNPKKDHARGLQPPVACNSCEDEKKNVDLCYVNNQAKSSQNGECKAKKSDDAVD